MTKTEFEQFDTTVRKISVSHDELKRREQEWKAETRKEKAG
jgi:hypothetical protein